MDLATGTDIEGRYVVEGHIGSGGMAEVYRVRHRRLDTLHALKVLTMTKRAVRRRLMQEGRVQAALQHPNIVRVSDLLLIGDAPCLVMEYVRGPSLDAFLPHWTFTEAQLDAVLGDVADGVGAAHALGLIHRDLKPANVMLGLTPTRLVPKVADFGLVKMVVGEGDGVGSQTRTGVSMGSPAYMPPEQVMDAKNVDHRADVWSLGALFYELLTGSLPFEGGNLYEIFDRVAAGQYPPVRSLVPDAPERMVRAIEGALVVDREERWPSVDALKAAWLEGAPVLPDRVWPEEALRLARELGAGEDETREALERSFREGGEVRGAGPPADATFDVFDADDDLPAFETLAPDSPAVPEERGDLPTSETLAPGSPAVPAKRGHLPASPTIAPEPAGLPEETSGVPSGAEAAPAERPESSPAGSPGGRGRLAWMGLGLLGAVGVVSAGLVASGGLGDPEAVVTRSAPADLERPEVEAPPAAPDEVERAGEGPPSALADGDGPAQEATDPAPAPADAAEPRAGEAEAAPAEPAAPPPGGPAVQGTASAGEPSARAEPPAGEADGSADEPAAVVPEPSAPPAEPAEPPVESAAERTGSPAPAPPSAPLVTVDADVTVRLRDDQGHYHEPAQAPEGRYDVVVFFHEGLPEPQGEITLEAGASPSIRCRKSLAACRIEP